MTSANVLTAAEPVPPNSDPNTQIRWSAYARVDPAQ